MLKKILVLILSAVLLSSCCGCGQEFSLDYIIPSMPNNIDPQLAESDTELLIVRNIFEGLFRYDASGKLVKGVTDTYEVDSTGLKYTFTINDNAVWNDGTKITASDFVFALKRAVDKNTKAANATDLLCIKNANGIINNNLPASSLGVNAVSDKVLEIELDYSDPYFLQTLASPITMPCNEEFFYSCGGKYGLSEKYILSNGPYKITKWKDQKKIRLIQNVKYNGNYTAKASAVYLSTESADTPIMQLLSNGNADLGEISYTQIHQATTKGLHTTTLQNTTYALLFNKSGIFKNEDLRKAFALSVHRNLYLNNLPKYFQKADSIFPQTISIGEENLQNTALQNKSIYEFDAQQARALFLSAVQKNNGQATTITVIYEDNEYIKGVLTDIVSQWQQVLGAYVNIQAVSSSALKAQVQNGNYTIAFCPLTDQNGNAHRFLEQFSSVNSINGYSNSTYDTVLNELAKNSSPLQNACLAEQLLLTDGSVIPIFYSQRIFAYNNDLKNVTIHNTPGYIDFMFIEK